MVFGRAKDFLKQIEAFKPSAIISLLPVVDQQGGYSIVAQGELKGSSTDKYYLVSLDQPVSAAEIDSMKIGVLDILGRKGMTSYIEQLFGKKISIKRVAKMEDLPPLLTFNAVDALFITSSVYEQIKAISDLTFISSKTGLSMGLSTVATLNTEDKSQINQCINNLPNDINQILGVETWK